MRTFVTLALAGFLCGCGGREQSAPAVNRAGGVGNETSEGGLAAAVPELIGAAKGTGIQSVETAIQTLKRSKNAVPALIEALQDDDHFEQLAAATALGEIGAPAVMDITRLLSHKEEDVRSWAIAILGAIGAPAATAVPLLNAGLDDPLPEISTLATTALTQIGGPEAKQVLAASTTSSNKAERAPSRLGSAGPIRSGAAETERQEVGQHRLRKLPRIPAELKPVLLALRRGKTWEANRLVWKHVDPLESWLSEVLIKGRTTRNDILVLLGPALKDLDRPKRDAIISVQYEMGDSASSTTLVFDFDPTNGVLTGWSTSWAICGFCPHVYADDGRWRLEGKLLAGCIGPRSRGERYTRLAAIGRTRRPRQGEGREPGAGNRVPRSGATGVGAA